MAQLLRGTSWSFTTVDTPHESYSQYQEPAMHTISSAEYSQHLKNEKILWALMQKGVHNFEFFEEAMTMALAIEDSDE